MTEEDAITSSRRRVNELIVRELDSQIYCSRAFEKLIQQNIFGDDITNWAYKVYERELT